MHGWQPGTVAKPLEKRLRKLFAQLSATDRETLLAFAEFLVSRQPEDQAEPLAEPELLPRPHTESVVAAIKRLSASYPMLDGDKILHEASGLMAQHVLHGRAAADVIDELEVVFKRHYQALVEKAGGDD